MIKNWALVREDLLVYFVNISVTMIVFMIGLLYMLSPGKQGVNFYMCLGENPLVDPYDYGKVSICILKIKYSK